MKTFVKFMCVLMCLLMVLSAFSACKDKPETPPDNDNSSENEDPNKQQETPDPVNPDPDSELLDDIMQRKYPGKQITAIIYPEDLLALVDYINSADGAPELTENVVYYLADDIDLNPGWSSAARVKNGKYLGTGAVPTNIFQGFDGFYGIFDGNGHSISGLYIAADEMEEGDSLGFFKVLGGSVKDLTLANTFVEGTLFDGDSAADINIGALAGTVVGDSVTIENVTVRASVIFCADESAAIGGVIGSTEADSLILNAVEFYGKAGLVAEDNTYPAPATAVSIAQFIGNALGNSVTLNTCVAGGTLVCEKDADGADDFCSVGNGQLTVAADCRVEIVGDETSDEEVIEIYVAEDLIDLWNDSTFEGQVVRLMADINFNPEWSFSEAFSKKAIEAPKRFWQGLPYFKGTFDGNGHTISGLCRVVDLSRTTVAGGFIDLLGEGATIKNLTISNSVIFGYASEEEPEDYYLGGIAAKADGNAVIENVLAEIYVWAVVEADGHIDGILADPESQIYLTTTQTFNVGAFGKQELSVLTEVLATLDPYDGGEAYSEELIEIYTAEDLMNVMRAAQDGETYVGKTVRLMNNIDLNPNWRTKANLNNQTNRISFYPEPINVWLGIPVFSGMFDGNGYSISGIYSWRNALCTNNGEYGGFIDTARNGAIIKDLIIKDSIHVVNNTGDSAWGSRNMHTGGLVARCDKTTDYEETFALTVSNVYVDMDVVILCSNHSTVGGILAFAVRHGDSYTSPYNLENVVFAGRIINTDFTKTVPFTSPKDQFAVGQIVADTNWGSQHKITNLLAAGDIICGNTTGVNTIFGAKTYSGVKCSNILIGRQIDTPSLGYNSKTDENDASFNANGWSYSSALGFYLPTSVKKMIVEGGHTKALVKALDDIFVPSPTANKIHVQTAEQLIALAESGNDFLGQIIYIDNDIDFNPGWSAKTQIVDGKIVFPEKPAVTWTAFASFKGIIDGQGHTIRGLYSYRTVEGNKGSYGGIIDEQSDGRICNLAILNSIHIVQNTSWGAKNIHVGGLVGDIYKTTVKSADKNKDKYALGNSENYGFVVSAFYTDMETWYVSAEQAVVGGLVGMVNAKYVFEDFVFAGKVGNTNSLSDGSASYASAKGNELHLGQVVGCGNFHSGVYIEDALVLGSIVTGTTGSNARYIHTYVGSDDKAGYNRCSEKLFATLPEDFPEDAEWTLTESGFMVPTALSEILTGVCPSLMIRGTTVIGIGLTSPEDVVGISNENGDYSVIIPDGVTAIGENAFSGLPNLVSVTLPATLTSIGESAFEGLTSLTSITLPNGFSIIGKSAFAGCTSLSTINFPTSLTSIGDFAFEGCTELQLQENVIPRGVNYIGMSAFRGCSNLTSIEFAYDQSVSLTIRTGAFDNLTTIRCNAKLLVGGVIPDFLRNSVTEIQVVSGNELKTNMFRGFTSLTTIRIPTIMVIRASAFNGCTALTTLEIPKSVTFIEEGAFRGLTAITAYTVEEGNENYIAIDGNLYTADGKTLLAYAAGKTEETFVLPSDVTRIATYSFDSFTSLTSLTYQGTKAELAEKVEFAENAFDQPIIVNCDDGFACPAHTIVIDVEGIAATCTEAGMTEGSHCSVCGEILSIPTEIPALGHDYDETTGICSRCGEEKASEGLVFVSNGDGTCYLSSIGTCTDAEIVIPSKHEGETVVGIGDFAFANTAITGIKIPASVTDIGSGAFANCSKLVVKASTIAEGNTVYTSTANGIFKDDGATLVRLSAHLSTYTLPATVTTIEDYAFAGCVKLVTLNASTTNPNYKAANGVLYTKDGTTLIAAKNATPITVAAGTKYIANGAFYGCDKLKKVTLASTVESIGDYAFCGCSALVTVDTGSVTDLKHVGTDAFKGTPVEATAPTGSED